MCEALPIDAILSKCSANYAVTRADILELQSADEETDDAVRALGAEIHNMAAEESSVDARLRQLERWQETLLTMEAAKSIQNEEDEGEDQEDEKSLSSRVRSIFGVVGVEEVLIACLVLTNVVLLTYLCLCKRNTNRNKPVYGGVRCYEQEELCD